MKLVCLLPVRDEADIIGQCLDRMITWADEIFVFDTGSIDDTWEIVLKYAATYKCIKPIKKDDVYYSETRLRGFIFHKARERMKDGDWFIRADADEFHYISPLQFIKERLHKHETIAYHQYYNFELTKSEAALLSSPEAVKEERKRPIYDRRRSYKVSVYSEPRLCKYRSTMRWPEHVSFPYNAGFLAKERLPILHYPNRDPLQMERRCKLRAVMLQDAKNKQNWEGAINMHWTQSDWKQFLVKDNDPALNYWPQNEPLNEVKQFNHLAPFHKRITQRIVHALFLPLLDAQRLPYPANAYPQKLTPKEIAELRSALC